MARTRPPPNQRTYRFAGQTLPIRAASEERVEAILECLIAVFALSAIAATARFRG